MLKRFVKMEIISYWQSNSNLDDGGIVELPQYTIIFSFRDKIGTMEKDKPRELKYFTYWELDKPDLRRIYLNMVPGQRNAKTYVDVLGNWRCDY